MATTQLEPGVILNDRYQIERVIGQGGMGTVYLAKHLRLDSVVAVKEVRITSPSDTERQTALQQCEAEGRFLVRLNHPNLPKVNDAFVEDERFFLVMEYIAGVTLESRLKQAQGKGLPIADVVEYGLQIADVLAYLHSQEPPVIFRDLKPANVMVQQDGSVRLIDFGIARRFQEGASKDTALFGSVGYSPPEQFGLRQTDARADIYSFGATLHHLLTGRDPAEQPFKFPPAHLLNPAVPESLSRLIEACLSVDAEKRPKGVHEVALALLAVKDEIAARGAALSVPPAPLPAGEFAPSPPPATGSKSGGPRIISAKLAEAEAQKRRSSSRRSPSGAVAALEKPATGPSTAEPLQTSRYLIIALCLLLVVGGTSVALVLQKKRANTPSLPAPPTNGRPAPNSVVVTPPKQQEAPPTENDTPPPPDGGVAITLPIVQELVTDTQGVKSLHFHVNGRIQGHSHAAATVALFFYDPDKKHLKALDPHAYANPDGNLTVWHSFSVDADDQPFDYTLDLPANQIPPDAPEGVTFRCVVFLDHAPKAETDFIELSPTHVTQPSNPGPTNPDAPPDTSSDPNHASGGSEIGSSGNH